MLKTTNSPKTNTALANPTLVEFQNIVDFIKDKFPRSSSYSRRYSYVGKKSKRTKLYNVTMSDRHFYNIKNAVENTFPYVELQKTKNKKDVKSLVIYRSY